MPELDITIPCVHCGQRGEQHHHREGTGPVGKGSGGLGPHEHLPTIPLCRPAHTLVHMGKLRLSLVALAPYFRDQRREVACGWEGDRLLFERGFDECDGDPDPRFWTDDRLANDWVEGDDHAKRFIGFQFSRRYASFDQWERRVVEIILDKTGEYAHWRRIEENAALYRVFWNRWHRAEAIGSTLALAVAKSADPEKSLVIADAAKENGRTSASAIQEIEGQG